MNINFAAAAVAAVLVAAVIAPTVNAATISLAGTGADGYFATVGLNQEGNTTLNAVVGSASAPKLFNYPSYVNPDISSNIYIMYVEPYQFGLSYPEQLHPTGPGVFASVGTLQQRNPGGSAPSGATFVEAFTEDADFSDTDIGQFDFDGALVTGVGTEIVVPAQLTLTLDGTEFQSTNNTMLNAADVGPFGSEGRSNRNEASNIVTIIPSNLVGTGLTFVNGQLTSIDLTLDVAVSSVGAAFPFPTLALEASGTLTFSGNQFAFDVDGQDSNAFGSDVRLLLNRLGSISAVVPEPATGMLVVLGALLTGGLARRR